MAAENEPAKQLLPYLQRADELQKHEHLVAYYCRLYAMERGLKIPQSDRTKTTNALLVSLMSQLEKDKKSLTLGPDDHLHLEGFALNVFAKADKQDRAGRADLNTAKTFYASSIFFEILCQFGELPADLEQKWKYAAWKAADIRKALKEGRKPLAGPPGGDDDLRIPSSDEYDFGTRSGISTTPDSSRIDPAAKTSPDSDSDSSPQVDDQRSFHHSTSIPPQSSNHNSTPAAKTLPVSDSSTSSSVYDHGSFQYSTNIPPQPSNLTPTNYNSTPAAKTPPVSDSSPSSVYDHSTFQHSTNIPPQPSNLTPTNYNSTPAAQTLPVSDSSPSSVYDHSSYQHSTNIPPQPSNLTPMPGISPPSNYPTDNYSSENLHLQHPIHHQSLIFQPHHPLPQHHFPSHDAPPYSYPNFQSYPSFTDSSLPAVPSHPPSYYQGSEASDINSSRSITSLFPSSPQPNSSSISNVSPPISQQYEYDSSYQPPPEKIAEAHKAARFAVGALAFDDVPVAVDYLKKSLELLTNPSAGGY